MTPISAARQVLMAALAAVILLSLPRVEVLLGHTCCARLGLNMGVI